jgi:hypothetical protein
MKQCLLFKKKRKEAVQESLLCGMEEGVDKNKQT